MQSVQDVHDRIVGYYYPTDPHRLRKKGNVANNTWAYPSEHGAVVRYHVTDIVTAVLGEKNLVTPTLWLDHQGWRTTTTLERLRWFLPMHVAIEKWHLRLRRPMFDAYVPFDHSVALYQSNGLWRVWNEGEAYGQRADGLRQAGINWARAYRPDLLEIRHVRDDGGGVYGGVLTKPWCSDCVDFYPGLPDLDHLIEHWNTGSWRRTYNDRLVRAALAHVGVSAPHMEYIDPRIVRRALTSLVPKEQHVLVKRLVDADMAYANNYNSPF